MKVKEQTEKTQLQFLEDMKEFNFPKWVNEKNNHYSLNLSFSGVSHVSNGLADLTMVYAGKMSPSHFLGEIIGDSLIGAFTCADAVNIQGMAIFVDFIRNIVPMELRVNK